MIGEGRNQSLVGQHLLQVDSDGLLWRSPGTEGKVKWSAIEKVESSEEHTFVYLNAVMAVVIPRAGVRSGVYEEFVSVLEDRVNRAAD